MPCLAQENKAEETDEVKQAKARVNQITSDSGRFFKQGLINLKDNRRPQAGEDFNKSVEVFLMSGINLTSENNAKAHYCYKQLVETIYRIEFPADAQLPQVRPLSATCGWNIDNQLADDIAKIVRQPNQPKANVDNSIVASAVNQIPTEEIIGFNDQKFEASPLDKLSKLELTPKEINAPNTIYARPTTPHASTILTTIRIVKAQAGDTVAKLAKRQGANAIEVAKFNGLLPKSVLSAGREIKIPIKHNNSKNEGNPIILVTISPNYILVSLGKKPIQLANGKVSIVMNYFNEFFHDPYSMRFVRWSKVEKGYHLGVPYWSVYVKYRAKNSFGAYVLSEMTFYIKNNKVIATKKFD